MFSCEYLLNNSCSTHCNGSPGPQGISGEFGLDGNSVLWKHDNSSPGAPNKGGFNTHSGYFIDASNQAPTTSLVKADIKSIYINYWNLPYWQAIGPLPPTPYKSWLLNISPGDLIYIRNRDETLWPNDFACYKVIDICGGSYSFYTPINVSFIED